MSNPPNISPWFYATIKDADRSKASTYSTLRDDPTDPPEAPSLTHHYGRWTLKVGAPVLVRKVVSDVVHWRGTAREWIEKDHVTYNVLFYGQHMQSCTMNEAAAKIFLRTVRRNGHAVSCSERDEKWAKDQMEKIWWELTR